MELLSPAGNLEKLRYAYAYGADAAYIGVRSFSLRTRADNFHADEHEVIRTIKGDKKLFGALNIFFHDQDIAELESHLDYLSLYPFDAFIISDIGILPLLRSRFPSIPLHLSTQANCLNSEAAKLYGDLGFSRIILGRETSLREVEQIKNRAGDMEIEVFVHGAMCLAYSGRCLLSSYMADRSANRGDCSHSCRWNYRLLEEEKRPGEYYPIMEDEGGFTTILSSKDLCMIDHIRELQDAGVNSLKIEGRMKSLYYTAVVTRAYRKALDHMDDPTAWAAYREDLFKVSHREYSTGFFFSPHEMDRSTTKSYQREYLFLGTLTKEISPGTFTLEVRNHIRSGELLEYIGPDIPYLSDDQYIIRDDQGIPVTQADHGKAYTITPGVPCREGYIIRKKIF